MIKHWVITGDTHGRVEERLGNIQRNICFDPTDTAVIILGDAGINFYLDNSDKKHKRKINAYGYTLYCVRGNHEERPENLGMTLEYDENVQGMVYFESDFPNIRYFLDGGEYVIDGHSTLVIGGAYSIDKYYRLEQAKMMDSSFSGWFEGEQLTAEEMATISMNVADKHYDFVFTHTCPISWEPSDLFIGGIDQSQVDKTMELWLDEVKDACEWNIWCFGHYHADRLERPGVEQFFMEYEDLDTVWNRWNDKRTIESEWWIDKSPNYHMS